MVEAPKITIEPGTMINTSRHEDDDAMIAQKPLEAIVVERTGSDAIKVIIPDVDADQTFYIHQPEKKAA